MVSAIRERVPQALFLPHAGKRPLIVEAVSVEADRRVRCAHRSRAGGGHAHRAASAARGRRCDMYSGGSWHRTPVFLRDALRPGDKLDGPAIIAEANATTVVEPGWQAEVTPLDHLVLRRVEARPARVAIGTTRRSGDAGGLQQPVHVDRRADGPAPGEHRLLGQHQGAARFLLRAVRRAGPADRQCAAHAGASGLDGRIDQDGHARKRGQDASRATSTCSTRPTTAARTCPTSR